MSLPLLMKTAGFVFSLLDDNQETALLESIHQETNQQTSLLESILWETNQQTLLLEGVQTSLGLIGVGTVLNLGLSVFSLYKINQLSKNVNQLRKDVKEGFWDLKNFVQERTDAVIDYQYQSIVSEAYYHYCQGVKDIQTALRLKNNNEHKKRLLYKSQTHFSEALIKYNSQALIKSHNAAEMLKHLEMITIVEGMQGALWFLLGEHREGTHTFKEIYKHLDTKLKTIGQHVDEQTFDLVLMDTHAIRSEDMKWLKSVG
ncbi:hypothetical protein [Thiospirillum jenense]|uniref:Uncharacterized protein n=1 Tax=Thiospirillum jenense TaxID=1653858 RepID=A0A839HIZ1_9GAMM|nr:hypothetical protein [Thiospirillum jenense]MBB1126986.1 hypothetical protein [Thiospirillum jenense]